MNTLTYFEIQSSQPKREVQFYATLFGWEFELEENLPIEYYRITTPGIAGGLLKRPSDTPPTHCGTNAFTCSIQVENFDETAHLISECGGRVAMPKFAIPGKCWQGYFIDPDHNVFGVVEINEMAQ